MDERTIAISDLDLSIPYRILTWLNFKFEGSSAVSTFQFPTGFSLKNIIALLLKFYENNLSIPYRILTGVQ